MARVSTFETQLIALLNKHSRERFSSTPDFLLANFLLGCLRAYEDTVRANVAWHDPARVPVPVDERAEALSTVMQGLEEIAPAFDSLDERLRLLVLSAGDDNASAVTGQAREGLVEYLLDLGWTPEEIGAALLRTLP